MFRPLRAALCALTLGAICAVTPQSAAQADNPEPGLQGQTLPGEAGVILARPYSKGVRVVGHEPLGERDSNIQLAWVDHCAYVSSSSPNFLAWGVKAAPSSYGVAVIDVADARAPKQVGLLRDRGSLYASETLHAVTAPGRKVLAAGSYGAKDDAAFTDLYDVSDCAHPKHMAEIKWPQSVHTLTLSPNGRRLYGTIIAPFSGDGGIAVMDIGDLRHPRFIGKFPAVKADGTSHQFAPHEISISADERRIYAGVISSRGADLNKTIKLTPSRDLLSSDGGGVYIFDNSDLARGRRDPKLRLIGVAEHGGWHSIMPARIGGVPHLVGGGELVGCPGAWPRIVNIANDRKPVVDGEFRLAMNRRENCPELTGMEKATAGLSPNPGAATLHFNDVDSATQTRAGLFNFMWAGLRIVDIRKPAQPKEVAYFKPGDACGGHVRYIPRTGDIWLVCGGSGFYVLQLKPEVRAALGYPRIAEHRRH
jgi:hypothetical protein